MKNKEIVLSGLFSSLIFITTAYLLHIPTGGSGYIHIGDTFIYLVSCILPKQYAIFSAIIGAGLSDLLTGAFIWIIPTIIIKSILVIFFDNKSDKIINFKNVIASIIAGIVGTFLYMVADFIIYGSFETAFLLSIITLIQPIGSFIAFLIIGTMLDKIDIKTRIKK